MAGLFFIVSIIWIFCKERARFSPQIRLPLPQLVLISMEELRFDKRNFSLGLADIEKAMRRMNKVARHYAGHGVIDDVCLETQKDLQKIFHYFLTAMEKTKEIGRDVIKKDVRFNVGRTGRWIR